MTGDVLTRSEISASDNRRHFLKVAKDLKLRARSPERVVNQLEEKKIYEAELGLGIVDAWLALDEHGFGGLLVKDPTKPTSTDPTLLCDAFLQLIATANDDMVSLVLGFEEAGMPTAIQRVNLIRFHERNLQPLLFGELFKVRANTFRPVNLRPRPAEVANPVRIEKFLRLVEALQA